MKNYILTTFSFLLVISCIPTDDNPINLPIVEQSKENFIVSNPDIPLFLQVKTDAEEIISYYGQKDSQGLVLSCNLITVQNQGTLEPTIYSLLNDGRIKSIYSPNGEYFEMDWIDTESLRIKAVTADGNVVASVPFSSSNSGKSNILSSKIKKQRKQNVISLSVNKISDVTYETNVLSTSNLNINVVRCDEPFTNGFVGVKAIPNVGDALFYQSGSNDNGTYQFKIATSNNSIDFNAVCSSIDNVLGYVCNQADLLTAAAGSTEQICTSISIALDLAFAGPTGEAVVLLPACEAIIRGTDLACSTLGKSIATASPSALSGLCDLFVKEYEPNSFVFEPRIYLDGEGIVIAEKTQSLSITDEFPNIEIELPNNPKFKDLSTNPFDPAPGQDYIATADINCGMEGVLATITVTGTDGFSDSRQVILPNGKSQISINIPGAEQAVTDFITVKADGIGDLSASIIF